MPHSLLPTWRHDTAVSINRHQIWNPHSDLPTCNIDWNLGPIHHLLWTDPVTYIIQTQALIIRFVLEHYVVITWYEETNKKILFSLDTVNYR